ncbi:MAG: hypothetical protein ACYS8Z_18800, partial [Planctomycetota bacterium]
MRNRDSAVSVLVGAVVCLFLCFEVVQGELGDPNSIARYPYPADGEVNVATEPNLTLNWSPGDFDAELFTIVKYHVHLDINEANVANASPWSGH